MLKPSDVITAEASDSPEDVQQRMQLEADFDAAIQRARRTGKWPAQVENARDTMLTANIEVTARKYRAVGWSVVLPQRGDIRAYIEKPYDDER